MNLVTDFKAGQKVKVLESRSKGDWSSLESVVIGPDPDFPNKYVQIRRSDRKDGFWYPKNLVLIESPKKEFKVGDRVQINYGYGWDGPATVTKIYENGHASVDTGRPGFYSEGSFAPKHLTLIEQETAAVQTSSVKAFGSPTVVFNIAKNLSVKLAKQNFSSLVSADDVQDELKKLGYSSLDLGNAAGNLFRGKNWKNGSSKKSTRAGNNAREISVWKYIGA